MRRICTHCGEFFMKSSAFDPYMCYGCEKLLIEEGLEEREDYLHAHY